MPRKIRTGLNLAFRLGLGGVVDACEIPLRKGKLHRVRVPLFTGLFRSRRIRSCIINKGGMVVGAAFVQRSTCRIVLFQKVTCGSDSGTGSLWGTAVVAVAMRDVGVGAGW